MSLQSISLCGIVKIGELLQVLCNSKRRAIDDVLKAIEELKPLLEEFGLHTSRAAMGSIEGVSINYYQRNQEVEPVHAAQLTSTFFTIAHSVYAELGAIQTFRADTAVPVSLDRLPEILPASLLNNGELEDHQKALWSDVNASVRSKSYRPAIVMMWALGFDLIRSWVFRSQNRLADFNVLLGQRTARRGSRAIVEFGDFFRENEAFVLEICRDAAGALQDFTGKTFRTFEGMLDDRNAFAHANFDRATEFEAKAYIDRVNRALQQSPFC